MSSCPGWGQTPCLMIPAETDPVLGTSRRICATHFGWGQTLVNGLWRQVYSKHRIGDRPCCGTLEMGTDPGQSYLGY